jgi:hypothetical protein
MYGATQTFRTTKSQRFASNIRRHRTDSISNQDAMDMIKSSIMCHTTSSETTPCQIPADQQVWLSIPRKQKKTHSYSLNAVP